MHINGTLFQRIVSDSRKRRGCALQRISWDEHVNENVQNIFENVWIVFENFQKVFRHFHISDSITEFLIKISPLCDRKSWQEYKSFSFPGNVFGPIDLGLLVFSSLGLPARAPISGTVAVLVFA